MLSGLVFVCTVFVFYWFVVIAATVAWDAVHAKRDRAEVR
jgi:hypothetical protein